MTVHNYRSRQVHETLNGVNPSSGFRDMRSAKSGPNLWQIWQVFGPWASPYGANGHMSMTVHNYRPRQFHRASNGENPSSGYRDMGSASLAAARPTARPPARPDRDDNTPPARRAEGWKALNSLIETQGIWEQQTSSKSFYVPIVCLLLKNKGQWPILIHLAFRWLPSLKGHWVLLMGI